MKESDFGKIRKAAKELAHNEAEQEGIHQPEAEHRRTAFGFLRELMQMDQNIFGIAIDALSKTKELRERAGEKRFETFKMVADEKTEEYRVTHPDFPETLTHDPFRSDAESEEELRGFLLFLDSTANAIKNDSRMKEVFSGHEELLNEIVGNQKTVMEIFAQGVLEQSRNKAELH